MIQSTLEREGRFYRGTLHIHTTVYNPDYIYYGYDYSVVPKAYHSLVANELDSKLLQCARSGLRAVEFRYFLEGVYNDYAALLIPCGGGAFLCTRKDKK